MLDVVLQLITFFMMLVHFGTRLEGVTRSVQLPTAPAALPGSDMSLDRLAVAIDDRGRLLIEDGSRNVAVTKNWWAEQARLRRVGLERLGEAELTELPTLVIVRADRAARYGVVRRTLRDAQRHGFARFALVVLRESPR